MSFTVKCANLAMKRASTVLVVGGGGGMPTLVKDVLYHNRDRFGYGVAMSVTPALTQTLAPIMPSTCVFDDFNSRVANKMMEKGGMSECVQGNMFVVAESPPLAQPTPRNLVMNGRHHKITVIYSVKDADSLPDNYMGQFDYVFLGEGVNIERAWMSYSCGLDLDVFGKVYHMCTDDGGYMMLKMWGERSAQWYTPRLTLPAFTMCTDPFGLLLEK